MVHRADVARVDEFIAQIRAGLARHEKFIAQMQARIEQAKQQGS